MEDEASFQFFQFIKRRMEFLLSRKNFFAQKEEKVWMQGERETTRDKVFYMFVFFPSSFFF